MVSVERKKATPDTATPSHLMSQDVVSSSPVTSGEIMDNTPTPAALRPRDAASLILVDRNGGDVRFLMGRRNSRLAFMPGKYVFPGGRVDGEDGSISACNELLTTDTQKLFQGMGSRPSLRRARALALCAIRETFEETGLKLVAPAGNMRVRMVNHPEWKIFLASEHLPVLAPLRYFARAVTPPGNVRRFDTRFFLVFRDAVPTLQNQTLSPSGELEDLGWVTFDQAMGLDIANITRTVLKNAHGLLSETNSDLSLSLPVVQYSARYGRYIREVI